MIRAALNPIQERLNLQVLQDLQCLENTARKLVFKHASEDLSLGFRQIAKKNINLVLVRQEITSGVLIPQPTSCSIRADLSLTIATFINKAIYRFSVRL